MGRVIHQFWLVGQDSGPDFKENEPTRHLQHALVFRLKYDGSDDPTQAKKIHKFKQTEENL